jgi:hypothetical protein
VGISSYSSIEREHQKREKISSQEEKTSSQTAPLIYFFESQVRDFDNSPLEVVIRIYTHGLAMRSGERERRARAESESGEQRAESESAEQRAESESGERERRAGGSGRFALHRKAGTLFVLALRSSLSSVGADYL